jgi:hypothetical protein
MDTTNVIIENWPHSPWVKDWTPIIIAIIALVTSIISLYWTRVQYEKSSRPFVWSSNYGVIDNEKKTIIPIPWRVACRVKNAPAKIIQMIVVVNLDSIELFKYKKHNFVQYPDETSEWNFSIGKAEFDKIMSRPESEKTRLVRLITISYSSLDGGKNYQFRLSQSFNPSENQWVDDQVDAD